LSITAQSLNSEFQSIDPSICFIPRAFQPQHLLCTPCSSTPAPALYPVLFNPSTCFIPRALQPQHLLYTPCSSDCAGKYTVSHSAKTTSNASYGQAAQVLKLGAATSSTITLTHSHWTRDQAPVLKTLHPPPHRGMVFEGFPVGRRRARRQRRVRGTWRRARGRRRAGRRTGQRPGVVHHGVRSQHHTQHTAPTLHNGTAAQHATME
jgi:hypothetical protein